MTNVSKNPITIRDHPYKTSPQKGREGGTKNTQKGDVRKSRHEIRRTLMMSQLPRFRCFFLLAVEKETPKTGQL